MSNNVAELRNEITNEQVDVAIAAFKRALGDAKQLAQSAAVLALIHTYFHRTASKLRELLATIEDKDGGKDFIRRAPFTLWLRAYAPVKMVTKEVDGKKIRVLEFDKESLLLAAEEETIAAATAKMWWTMSPDREQGAFDLVNFDKKILAIAKRAFKSIQEEGDAVSPTVLAHVAGVMGQFERYVAANKAAVNAATIVPTAGSQAA